MSTPTGWCTIGTLNDLGVFVPHATALNARMHTAGFLIAKVLGQQDVGYAIRAAYIEYANMADASLAYAVPSVDATDTTAYYDGLASVSDRDYLRVPLRALPMIGVASGQEAYYAAGQGNLLQYLLASEGTVGVHGKPFGTAAGSRVIGIALAAAPDFSDRSRDVLFARAYYTGSAQLPVPASGQVTAQYTASFAL